MVAKSAPRSQENKTRQYLNCTPSVAFPDTLCGLDPELNPACPERQSTRNHNITFVEHHTCLRPKWVPWADLATSVRLTSGRHVFDMQATLTLDKKRATHKSLGVHKDRSKECTCTTKLHVCQLRPRVKKNESHNTRGRPMTVATVRTFNLERKNE